MQDEDGCVVYDEDWKPLILTDGTGFISEDLALRCPNNLCRGKYMTNGNSDVCDSRYVFTKQTFCLWFFMYGKLSQELIFFTNHELSMHKSLIGNTSLALSLALFAICKH